MIRQRIATFTLSHVDPCARVRSGPVGAAVRFGHGRRTGVRRCVALLSDYRFRGESLTEGRPALQAGVNYDHSSGLFVGGLVSNVRIDPDVVGLGAQIYGGYTPPDW